MQEIARGALEEKSQDKNSSRTYSKQKQENNKIGGEGKEGRLGCLWMLESRDKDDSAIKRNASLPFRKRMDGARRNSVE